MPALVLEQDLEQARLSYARPKAYDANSKNHLPHAGEPMIWQALSWIVFGFFVGLIARVLMPGRQPMGWTMTIILGIVGSFVGGTIGTLLSGRDVNAGIVNPGGWIASILGGLIVLGVVGYIAQRNSK